MKIVLSKYWRYELLIIFCIQLLCIMLTVLSLLKDFAVMLILSLCGSVTITVAEIVLVCSCYRFLTYVIIENNTYTSFLFKKRLCVIDTAKPIYHVIFSAREGMFSEREFVVLSNEPIAYEEKRSLRIFPWEKKPLIAGYDTQKQIVLPYNEETRSILKMEA